MLKKVTYSISIIISVIIACCLWHYIGIMPYGIWHPFMVADIIYSITITVYSIYRLYTIFSSEYIIELEEWDKYLNSLLKDEKW